MIQHSTLTTRPWSEALQRKRTLGKLAPVPLESEKSYTNSINIVSDAFEAKSSPARHRMIYGLLKEELDRPGGVHALQLRTKTPLENAKSQSS